MIISRNIIFVISLLVTNAAFSKLPLVVSESYFFQGINPVDQNYLNDICVSLKTDHKQDLEQLHSLYATYKTLLAGSNTMQDIHQRTLVLNEIRLVSQRIITASNPAWNKEEIEFEISWRLPRELFFNEEEYKLISLKLLQNADLLKNTNQIKKMILQIDPKFKLDLISFKDSQIKPTDFIKVISNPNSFVELKIIESFYWNEPNEEIKKYFHFPWYIHDERGLILSLEKKLTALEYCQIMSKTKFLIQVNYVYEVFGLAFKSSKDIWLEIKARSL